MDHAFKMTPFGCVSLVSELPIFRLGIARLPHMPLGNAVNQPSQKFLCLLRIERVAVSGLNGVRSLCNPSPSARFIIS